MIRLNWLRISHTSNPGPMANLPMVANTCGNVTTHADLPAISEIADTLPIEGELVDAMGTGEERDTDGAGGIHGSPGEETGSFNVSDC